MESESGERGEAVCEASVSQLQAASRFRPSSLSLSLSSFLLFCSGLQALGVSACSSRGSAEAFGLASGSGNAWRRRRKGITKSSDWSHYNSCFRPRHLLDLGPPCKSTHSSLLNLPPVHFPQRQSWERAMRACLDASLPLTYQLSRQRVCLSQPRGP